jgi:hypothetical protein
VLDPRDADKQQAKVDFADHAPTWTSSNAEVALAVADDAMSAVATAPAGFRGSAQIQAVVDADLDAGEVRDLVALADLEYVSGEAVVLDLNATLEAK